MTVSETEITFRSCRAATGPALYLAAAYDKNLRDHEGYYPQSCVLQYSRANNAWASFTLDQFVRGLCVSLDPGSGVEVLVALSVEGEVTFKRAEGMRTETIPNAGIFNDRPPPHHGRVFDIREIGKRMYACGMTGQLYRRDAPDDWRLLDPAFLVDEEAYKRVKDAKLNKAGDDWGKIIALSPEEFRFMDEEQRKSFHTINGPSEHEVYASGYDGGLALWDGAHARLLDTIPKRNLFGILVENERTVWVCGSEGTLLRGNHRDGFDDLSVGGELSFGSMAMFGGQLYLAANGGFGGATGLFTVKDGQAVPVKTDLVPEIEVVTRVDAADGVLWAMNGKEIYCFDGHGWERILYPGNKPPRPRRR